jgi:hypothetical protein
VSSARGVFLFGEYRTRNCEPSCHHAGSILSSRSDDPQSVSEQLHLIGSAPALTLAPYDADLRGFRYSELDMSHHTSYQKALKPYFASRVFPL